jgi:uncharacterized membrane protein YdbT with pleckstrin-like domain
MTKLDTARARSAGRTSISYFWGYYLVAGALLVWGLSRFPEGDLRAASGGGLVAVWAVVLGIAVLAWPVVSIWFGTRWWVTEEGVVASEGVISRDTREIRLDDVGEVEVRQGWIARLFGFGSVLVSRRDRSGPGVVLAGVRAPNRVAAAIREDEEDGGEG